MRNTRVRSLLVGLVVILIPILYASLPLFQKNFIPTHDGEYHIIRFAEFYSMLHAGYLFPRWAPHLNSGYGVPLFNFHYPFPNYVGSILHVFGWSFVDSFKVALALAYIFGCIGCFLWLRKLFRPFPALIGTIVFSFIPYWFVDIYVRGAIGEVWAFTFLIAAFISVEYAKPRLLAVCFGLLILSHNISAMIISPILLGYVLLRNRSYVWSLCLGFILAAYFWLPALFEKNFVTGLNSVDFRDHFPMLFQLIIPSWGTGFSVQGHTYDELSFQIGFIPLIILFWSPFVFRREKEVFKKRLYLLFSAACIGAVFLMLDPSQWIWEHIPFFPFIQYPWRLLSIFLPSVAFIAAWVASRVKWKWIRVGLAIAAILFSLSYIRPVQYEPRTDAHYLSRKEFTDGTSSLGNTFSTIWSTWKKQKGKDKVEVVSGSAKISASSFTLLDYTFTVQADISSVVRVNTLYYPGWTVDVDRKEVRVDYKKDGTMLFSVPSGAHAIHVYFVETRLRKIADAISFFGLFWLIGSAILDWRYAYRNRNIIPSKRS